MFCMGDIADLSFPFRLRHLKYFVVVAEELHFGRAAQRLRIAQPPLSQQIQRLEAQLGVQLFRRNRRSVEMTAHGAALLPEARSLLRHAQHVTEMMAQTQRGDGGTLRLGFVSSAAHEVLPRLLRTLRETTPSITVEPNELATNQQVEALKDGSLDVGIVRVPVQAPGLVLQPLITEPLVAALPDFHPLAGRKRIPLSALADEPFVLWARRHNHMFHDTVISACAEAGFRPHIGQEAGELGTILGLVAGGLGVSLVPESTRRSRGDGIACVPLQGPSVEIVLALAWREDDGTPLIRTIADTARGLWPTQPTRRRRARDEVAVPGAQSDGP